MERYIVERIRDGKFLELELPVDVSGAGKKLSGAGPFSGTVDPDTGGQRDSAEKLLVDPFATLIHREIDGVIRGSYMVTRCAWNGSKWAIEGSGFSSYLTGLVYEGSREWVNADPIGIIRHVWEHAQGQTNANLGVTVKGSSSVRIGDPKRDVEFRTSAGEQVQFQAGPYTLRWWDTPDLAKTVQDLAIAAGQEFVERSYWNSDKTKILKEIHYKPRVGKRLDVKFEQGVNVTDVVDVVADGADFANAVVAIGAGEGAKALRVTLAASDSRLRRVRVMDRKNVTTRKVLEADAQAELKRALRKIEIAAVEVMNHPMAEFGTWDVGDDVLVDVDTEWQGRVTQWSRITEVEYADDRARLTLEAV